VHAAWEREAAPDRVLIGNVGGEQVAGAVERACRSHWGCEPRFAQTAPSACGVTVAYEHPERLGVDRWLALIAAHRLCDGPVLVIDAGTAVTFDLLLGDGSHLGGLILPGMEMMRSVLLSGTHIPRVEPEELAEPWAGDTGTAVAAGSIQASAALAERLHNRLAQLSGAQPECLLTGGDAQRLAPALRLGVTHRPDLVLQGLALLA
jgi:type III pantothenate kinase